MATARRPRTKAKTGAEVALFRAASRNIVFYPQQAKPLLPFGLVYLESPQTTFPLMAMGQTSSQRETTWTAFVQ
jgi:hypothetical protein